MFVGCWAHNFFGGLRCGVALDIAACVCVFLVFLNKIDSILQDIYFQTFLGRDLSSFL